MVDAAAAAHTKGDGTFFLIGTCQVMSHDTATPHMG